jgi:hypothetical protein
MTAAELYLMGLASDLQGIGRTVHRIDLDRGTMTYSNPKTGIRTRVRARYIKGKLVIQERREIV